MMMTLATLIIGVAGGSASGKTTLAHEIKSVLETTLGPGQVEVLSQDEYFFSSSDFPKEHYIGGKPNGDHPSALDLPRMIQDLKEIKAGRATPIPHYDYVADRSTPGPIFGPFRVVIAEGIFALQDPELRMLMDYKVFVDLAEDERLRRRIVRDEVERAVSKERSVSDFYRMVKPMHDLHIDPTREFADEVVNGHKIQEAALRIASRVRAELCGSGLYSNSP